MKKKACKILINSQNGRFSEIQQNQHLVHTRLANNKNICYTTESGNPIITVALHGVWKILLRHSLSAAQWKS